MNKIALTVALLFSILCQGKAQGKAPSALTKTAWKVTAYVPDPTTCVMKFGRDTVWLVYVDDREISISDDVTGSRSVTGKDSASLESMTYRLTGDTLELRKITGGSPCGDEKGTYRAQVSNGKMKLIPIEDPCALRSNALREEMVLVK